MSKQRELFGKPIKPTSRRQSTDILGNIKKREEAFYTTYNLDHPSHSLPTNFKDYVSKSSYTLDDLMEIETRYLGKYKLTVSLPMSGKNVKQIMKDSNIPVETISNSAFYQDVMIRYNTDENPAKLRFSVMPAIRDYDEQVNSLCELLEKVVKRNEDSLIL